MNDSHLPTNYFVQSWQVDEGLPYGTVNRVLQDRQGYLWLATVGGLTRFDGAAFKQFSSSLVADTTARNIRDLALDKDGSLLMLPATGGVVRWQEGAFTRHPMSESLAGKQLETIFVEPQGAVWVCATDKSLMRWQDGRLAEFTNTTGASRRARASFAVDAEGQAWVALDNFLGRFDGRELVRFTPPLGSSLCVAAGHSGGVWVCDSSGLWKIEKGRVSTISTNLPWAGLNGKVLDLFEDREESLWIGTSTHGLFHFDHARFGRVTTSHSGINSIIEDHEDSLWVATEGGGINRVRQKIFLNFDSRAGLRDDVSDAVCEDHAGNIWLGNRNGGLARVTNGQVTLMPLFEGRQPLGVNSVCADDLGRVWAGTGAGLYRCSFGEPPVAQRMDSRIAGVHVLFKSRNGDVWVGADPDLLGCYHGDQFQRFSDQDGFTGRKVRAIVEDANGGIWVGAESGQLFFWSDGRFTLFTPEQGLPRAPIQCLYADRDGLLWIGAAGGLCLRQNHRFVRFSPADGLADDVIYQILEDNYGRLWFGSRRGIFHVAKKELLEFAAGRTSRLNSISFGKGEGLAGVYCFGSCQPMAWKARDGWLWFATKQGVLALDPAALRPNAHPPPVYIEECLVNDRAAALKDEVRVPPGRKKLEFRFAALSYAAPEKVRLRYQLEGVDSEWTEIRGQRSAVYPGLPPGSYRLRVTACNNDGVWNEQGAVLAFIVLPAWWQTWWVQSAGLAVFMVAVVFYARYWSHRRLQLKLQRLEQQHAVEKERARIARDLHDNLGASLTQIGLLADMARHDAIPAEEVREQSAQLAARTRDLARELDAIVWTVNPGNDTLENLVTYLCQVSQELFRLTPIRCRLDVADEIPACPLSPEARHALFLVARESMNNVIKHSGASEVWLRAGVRDGALELSLEDNGRGFALESAAHSKRNGLRNMRARMEEIGGVFSIRSEPSKGTVVSLRFPLNADAGLKNLPK